MTGSTHWVARSLGELQLRLLSGAHRAWDAGDDTDCALALVDPSHPICREAQFHLQGVGLNAFMGIENFDCPGQNTYFLVPAESLALRRIRARRRSWRARLPVARALILSAGGARGHLRSNGPKQVLPALLQLALERADLLWRPFLCDFERPAQIGQVVMRRS
jgi:hypothetical protein